jgi:tetraacyldisaccharide 4'-kinase
VPPVPAVPKERVLAVAGIANPERFAAALRDAGWNVVGDMTFPDHHRYHQQDVAAIEARLKSAGADAVFTTDKDAVRFEALHSIPFPLYRVPLVVRFDPADALFESVRAVLG